jgi:hypothetical protein
MCPLEHKNVSTRPFNIRSEPQPKTSTAKFVRDAKENHRLNRGDAEISEARRKPKSWGHVYHLRKFAQETGKKNLANVNSAARVTPGTRIGQSAISGIDWFPIGPADVTNGPAA